jgi:hypothetical protein
MWYWNRTSIPMEPDLTEEEERALEKMSERFMRDVRRRWVTVAIFISSVGIFVSLILPYYSATQTASSIKHGQYPSVEVRYRSFSGSAGQVTVPDLMLIGATQKAVFFYDVDEKRTTVIPQAQLVSIEVPEQD